MSLWNVSDARHVQLQHWCLVMTERAEVHIAGYDARAEEGRVSSALASFDVASQTAKTRRGRDYTLTGDPGLNGDALYVLEGWLALNRVPSWLECTEEVMTLGFDIAVARAKQALEAS